MCITSLSISRPQKVRYRLKPGIICILAGRFFRPLSVFHTQALQMKLPGLVEDAGTCE